MKKKKAKTPKRYWNHRIMVSEYKGEKFFEIHEVHYKDGKPDSYTADAISVHADNLRGIKWALKKMVECTSKPAIWKGERWPQEYTGKIPKININKGAYESRINEPVTKQVVKQAMDATLHHVRVPKHIRNGTIARKKADDNH